MKYTIGLGLLLIGIGAGGAIGEAINSEPQVNECRVTREGSRPGEYDREYWQSFRCADDYEFTLVWIRNTFGNALQKES